MARTAWIIIVIFVFSGLNAVQAGAEVKNIFKQNGRIYAEALRCDDIELPGTDQTDADAPGKCTRDITDALPAFIVEHAGTSSVYDGPNCWQSAMSAAGLANPEPMYMSSSEVEYVAELGGFCTEVKKPRPFDIIYIYYPKDRPLEGLRATHAFTYLGNGWSFSKDGYKSHVLWKLERVEDVTVQYMNGREKQEIKYLRCKEAPLSGERAKQLMARLDALAARLSPMIMKGTQVMAKYELQKLEDDLWKLYKSLKGRFGNDRSMNRVFYRVKSHISQLGYLIHPKWGLPDGY
ncbi:MAG: hypothetical protein A2583_12085 [Bdellovibrionales bacterium RIFOXYD1_FULL_53_11]|nr:MAG: hypothetical protein A2583_12085 [Bdellovibrionales bacterium RIFOXYD1_FULL_53_11]